MTLEEWDAFCEFAVDVSRKNLQLFGHINSSTLKEYLSFHALHGNLFITKDGDGWAFAVVRPVSEQKTEFNWTQPQSDTDLLDVLFSRSKRASLRLLLLYFKSGKNPSKTIYFHKNKFREWNTKVTKRFFYGIN